jgi:hypothetical protein
LFAPSSVRLKVADGTLVEFIEQTEYPFDEAIHFTYKNKGPQLSFPFHLRIPAWCKKGEIRINGERLQEAKGGQVVRIDRKWKDGDELTLTLPMEVSVENWNENAVSIERGPLTYALKIEEEWKKVKNNDPYGDYFEVLPQSPWNYALMNVKQEDWQKAFKVVKKGSVSDKPWNINNAPIEIEAKAVLLPDWTMYNGSAGPLPYSPLQMPENGKPVSVTLIPYGCTTLRIAEFPTVE